MARTEFYNGYMFQIETVYHDFFYGNETLYKVTTEMDNFSQCYCAMESILEDKTYRKGLWKIKKKSFIEYLKGWHEMWYSEEDNCLYYKIHIPYDD